MIQFFKNFDDLTTTQLLIFFLSVFHKYSEYKLNKKGFANIIDTVLRLSRSLNYMQLHVIGSIMTYNVQFTY
jgi:hypothetical protein